MLDAIVRHALPSAAPPCQLILSPYAAYHCCRRRRRHDFRRLLRADAAIRLLMIRRIRLYVTLRRHLFDAA